MWMPKDATQAFDLHIIKVFQAGQGESRLQGLRDHLLVICCLQRLWKQGQQGNGATDMCIIIWNVQLWCCLTHQLDHRCCHNNSVREPKTESVVGGCFLELLAPWKIAKRWNEQCLECYEHTHGTRCVLLLQTVSLAFSVAHP